MSADTLDSLSNAELNERFARQVAGATQIEEAPGTWRFYGDNRHQWREGPLPDYCGSMDAVTPWIDQWAITRVEGVKGSPATRYRVDLFASIDAREPSGWGLADALARACVIALLRATGAKGGESS